MTEIPAISEGENTYSDDLLAEVNNFSSYLAETFSESQSQDAARSDDLNNNFLDQTWLSFVEFCRFINKYIDFIEIDGPSTSKNGNEANTNAKIHSGDSTPITLPKNVKLVLKKEYSTKRDELVVKLVNILKKLVLRELFIGTARTGTASSTDVQSESSSKTLPCLIITT